jgi:hypothetical protein
MAHDPIIGEAVVVVVIVSNRKADFYDNDYDLTQVGVAA